MVYTLAKKKKGEIKAGEVPGQEGENTNVNASESNPGTESEAIIDATTTETQPGLQLNKCIVLNLCNRLREGVHVS